MIVKLSAEEKTQMCVELSQHLVRLRQLLRVNQAEFSDLCGIGRTTISQIENGRVRMSWHDLCAILFVCAANSRTKEYFYASRLLGPRFLQFIQLKDEAIPPDTNVTVREDLILPYHEFLTFCSERRDAEN